MAHTLTHTPMLPRSLLTNGKMCQIHSPVTGIKCQRCASSGHIFLTFIVLTEPGNPKHDLFLFFFANPNQTVSVPKPNATVCTASQQCQCDDRT